MTDRTWTDGGSGTFRDAANWTPRGTPAPGDRLTIDTGEATASHDTLRGLAIALANPRLFQRPDLGPRPPSPPTPVLSLKDTRIAADSTIVTQGEESYYGPRSGIIDAQGRVENDGRIEATTIHSPEQYIGSASLDLHISGEARAGEARDGKARAGEPQQRGCEAPGVFVNKGTLAADFVSGLHIDGNDAGRTDRNALLVNDGTIRATAYGSVGIDTNLIGRGTVLLDSTPAFLPTPPPFVYWGTIAIGADARIVGSGQDFVFNGGHLEIDSTQTCFRALLSDFTHLTDAVVLRDFHVAASGVCHDALTLRGSDGTTERLRFAGHHALSDFTIKDSGDGTVITPAHPTSQA